ncbi:MAG: oligopeptide/dipeptide ABC transporter ATP-binding protein [Thermodesulfobacteriota bacterium]
MNTQPLLEIKNLKKYFPIQRGTLFSKEIGVIKAIDGLTLNLDEGKTLGLVGESGCGKSTTGLAILKLLEPTSGEILFEGENIGHFDRKETFRYRHDVQAVFQNPYASLNPRLRIGEIIEEPMYVHKILNPTDRLNRVRELLEVVGMNPDHLERFPHEFSGGQRQRIAIARALSVNPKLLVLDEPVSALDVSIRAQILNLLMDLQKEFGLTYLLISHDLSVVEHISDVVAVMYLGKLVEMANCEDLYRHPLHPYTQALLSAIPIPDPELPQETIVLEGEIVDPASLEGGCIFRNRCPKISGKCNEEEPILKEIKKGHSVACHVASG